MNEYSRALIGTIFLFILIEIAVVLITLKINLTLYLIGIFDLSACFLISLYINYKFIQYKEKEDKKCSQ